MRLLKLVGITVILFVAFVLFLSTTGLAPKTSPEKQLVIDRDMCMYNAGIRRDTPALYEATKALRYGGYVHCIIFDLGYNKVPPLP